MSEKSNFPAHAAEIRMMSLLLVKLTHRDFEDRLSQRNLTLTPLQFHILRSLWKKSFTLGELSRMLMLDPSTLVPVVNLLEKKGMLVRKRDPKDRRRVPMELTRTTEELFESLPEIDHDGLLTRSLKALGEEKTNQLIDLMRELIYTMPDGESMFCQVRTAFEPFQNKVDATAQALPQDEFAE